MTIRADKSNYITVDEFKVMPQRLSQRKAGRSECKPKVTESTIHRLPRFERAEVRVVYYFRTNRRRDQDNYAPKQLLDSMRKAGILADDNAEVLRLLPVEFQVDRDRPRTEVFVREWVG